MSLQIEKILKSIVKNPTDVKHHEYWGDYIQVDFPWLHMIGLIEKDGRLELSLYFGESQAQSKALYDRTIRFEKLGKEWDIFPNFHISNSFRNIFWFDSPKSTKVADYIHFWENNYSLFYRHDREDIEKFLIGLGEKGIIVFDAETRKRFQHQVLDKKYSQFNICASIGITYPITYSEATELDKNGKFRDLLIAKINEGLSILNANGNGFLADPPDPPFNR